MRSERRGETQLFRAAIFHTPSDPFKQNTSRVLQAFADGGLVVRDGRVIACGAYEAVRAANPGIDSTDWRGGFLLTATREQHKTGQRECQDRGISCPHDDHSHPPSFSC